MQRVAGASADRTSSRSYRLSVRRAGEKLARFTLGRCPDLPLTSQRATASVTCRAATRSRRRRVPRDDRRHVGALGQRAEAQAAVAAQARGAEGVGDRGLGAWRTSSEPWRASASPRPRAGRGARRRRGRRARRAGPRRRRRGGGRRRPPARPRRGRRPSTAGSRASARRTSSALTLPEPSQIEFSGASRYRRGIPDSST